MTKANPFLVFAVAAVLGAATWLIWCGFDTTYYLDDAGNSQGPYRAWQVVGCGITYLSITAAGSYYFLTRASPPPAIVFSIGMAFGFWLTWTIQAAMSDDSGLFVIGAALLGVGLSIGTLMGVGAGVGLKAIVVSRRTGSSVSTKPQGPIDEAR